MRRKRFATSDRSRGWWPVLALAMVFALAALAPAQEQGLQVPESLPTARAADALPAPSGVASEVTQVGCSTCGGGLLSPPGDLGCIGCGAGRAPCYPGHEPCDCPAEGHTGVGRLLLGIYECVCCPDPCYEPHWNILGNAAFFADEVRPATQTRLRVDSVWDHPFPDKGEFFWARADGKGKMQRLTKDANGNTVGERNIDYSGFKMCTEAAVDKFSLFVETSYLHTNPDTYPSASGLGDLVLGTKSMLIDCELLQFTFQFKTFLPTANFSQGLGTGHTSLEPSLLYALKLAPSTVLQGQIAYWFPIGGDSAYQGSVFHYHLSLNHMLWSCGKGIQLAGVLEANGYNFQNGQYTIPAAEAPQGTVTQGRAADVGSIFSIGPGARLNFCNKIDFGVGSAFALTQDSIGDVWVRADFRWRF